MKVKFKKLHEGARLPEKATAGSAAYDLYVPEDVIIEPGRQIIQLGFAMEMEEGYEALVDPRSGFSSKGKEGYEVMTYWIYNSHFGVLSGPCTSGLPKEPHALRHYVAMEPERFDCDVIEGKIDSDYRLGVGVIVHNRDKRTFLIKAGTRIAQMTFHKVESVDWEVAGELSESTRKGGFGHSGTK